MCLPPIFRGLVTKSSYPCLAAVVLVSTTSPVSAAEFMVSSASDISTAMNSAQPGDTLVMTDGVWTNQRIRFAGFGSAANPITLRPQTPGGVTLNGNSTLSISGDWLVADGLNFEGGALSSGNIVEFRGSNGNATNSRFTNSAIVNYNPPDINTRYFWVSLYGDNNRVDNNFFSGQDHSGVTVVEWADGTTSNNRIDRNYFADRPEGNGNGFETIRIGTSSFSMSNSNVIVENNLFERTDGEIEIISNKTGGNTYRYNTFKDSAGTLTLRHGNGATVEGNFFLGQGKNKSGGVRVIGEDHTIINNYFANLDDRADGVISLTAGVVNSPLNRYFQVKNAVIAHNTFVDSNGPQVTFDYLYDPVPDPGNGELQNLLPENVTMANNLFRSSGAAIFEGLEGSGWTWEGNIAFGGSLGPKSGAPGITVVDPQLALGPDGLWRPASWSPAVNGGAGGYSGVLTDDMDGQARIGVFDVGADEFSTATIVRAPLSAGDVGPDWLDQGPPVGGSPGCNSAGCAIQAEDYKFLTDPNNNGLVWSVVDTTDALGGQALRAPLGNLVDLGSGPHDTLAVYDIEFSQEGTYTAYYRARGFSTGTDSLFVPDGFNINPTVNENLSENGVFAWEKGLTFVVGASLIGVPLEFRFGRREQLSEFDAFVLHMDPNLTDVELDALFDPLVGDLDGDGFVGISDLNLVLGAWNQSVPPADAAADPSGDGFVGIEDLNTVLGNWNAGTPPPGEAPNAIPEPTILALLAAGGLGVIGRWR
jgi:Chondroitinase B